jgi:multiple sugar transport system permease protein
MNRRRIDGVIAMGYRRKKRAKVLLRHLTILLLSMVMIYPVIWLVSASFKDTVEIVNHTSLLPQRFVLYNYPNGFKGFGNVGFLTFFSNSIYVSVLSTIGVALSSAVVAYGFTRIRFPGRNTLFACMLVTMMLPEQITLMPQYIIFNILGWINSYLPLIVPSFLGKAFFIFLMMQFIQGIPKELDEAAVIDGCSRFGVFGHIIMPMIFSAMVTTIVINFYWKWDEFLPPMLYLSRPEKYTVTVALKAFVDATSATDYGALFAMSTLSIIPVFLLFLFFNRYLLEGVSTTGLKG